MDTENTFEKNQKTLKKHAQSHILAFWDQLNKSQQQNLLAQINTLDFEIIDSWITNLVLNNTPKTSKTNLKPAFYYKAKTVNAEFKLKYEKAAKLGKKLISEGKVAAF